MHNFLLHYRAELPLPLLYDTPIVTWRGLPYYSLWLDYPLTGIQPHWEHAFGMEIPAPNLPAVTPRLYLRFHDPAGQGMWKRRYLLTPGRWGVHVGTFLPGGPLPPQLGWLHVFADELWTTKLEWFGEFPPQRLTDLIDWEE